MPLRLETHGPYVKTIKKGRIMLGPNLNGLIGLIRVHAVV
jgi:hypothetical protein